MSALALALLAAASAAYGTWTLLGIRRTPAVRAPHQVESRSLELWLLGSPLPERAVPLLQILAAIAAATAAQLATGNPVVALLLASLAWHIPTGLIASLAARVWSRADEQSHTLANVLQFALPVQGNPYTALRHVIPDLDEPLAGWLRQAVAGEAVGRPVEEGLSDLAARLRHQELGLLAAILHADRTATPSQGLLTDLLPEWTARVRSGAERRTTLLTAQAMSNLFIWGPMAAFLVIDAFIPAGAVFHRSLIGQAVAAAGMAILTAAAHIHRSTLASERRLQSE